MERREKRGQKQYMEAMETLEKRTNDKLLEKTSWYKGDRKRKKDNKESKYKYKAPTTKRRQRAGQQHQQGDAKRAGNTKNSKVKAVMFVPFTKHSELANRLRENEDKMESMAGYRMKIVERGGCKLVDMLHKANPWAGEDCGRERCLLCSTKKEEGKENSQDCKRRNCAYETTCITCTRRQDQEIEQKYGEEGKKRIDEEKRRAKRYIYIGETNRSVYERGIEHQNDVTGCKTSSHMLRHLLTVHEEEEEEWDKIKFGMRILKSTKTAFERQILESVLIQKAREQNIMNNKSEYNRCALPRLTAKLGERDMEKWREEDRLEHQREASLEEKIRIRKKARAKMRAEASRRREKCQPAKKRRKMDRDTQREEEKEEAGYTMPTVEESNTINSTSATPKCKVRLAK